MANMYMPIWLLYWFPFFLPINYAIKCLHIFAGSWLSEKCVGKMLSVKLDLVGKMLWHLLISFATDFLGLTLFYIAEMHLFTWEEYEQIYPRYKVFVFFAAVVASILLNYCFAYRKVQLACKYKAIICVFISLLAAPYLFLLLEL